MTRVITCVGESYHSTDQFDDHTPINLAHGESVEVSDEKADQCRELVGLVEVAEPADETPDLSKLKRGELNDLAQSLGVEAPEKLSNAGEVIKAIEAKQAEQAEG